VQEKRGKLSTAAFMAYSELIALSSSVARLSNWQQLSQLQWCTHGPLFVPLEVSGLFCWHFTWLKFAENLRAKMMFMGIET